MTPSPFAERFVDRLFDLFAQRGQRHYGEGVSQLDHALQTAHHARLDGASPALIAASLLHDVGHLLQRLGEDAADRGLDDQHERIGARYLARAYGPAVTEPVLIHHGTSDDSCPVRWSRATARLMERAGVDVTMRTYPGEEHAFGPQFELSMERTERFLARHLG